MSKTNKEKHVDVIGPKTKGCLIVIWIHILTLTWIILSNVTNIYIQLISFISTVIIFYLHALIVQDYFFIKTNNERCIEVRKDIRLIEPILPERFKKNDN